MEELSYHRAYQTRQLTPRCLSIVTSLWHGSVLVKDLTMELFDACASVLTARAVKLILGGSRSSLEIDDSADMTIPGQAHLKC
jgi:hypothetical protein